MLLNNFYNLLKCVGTTLYSAQGLINFKGETKYNYNTTSNLNLIKVLWWNNCSWELRSTIDSYTSPPSSHVAGVYYIYLGKGTSADSREFYTITPLDFSIDQCTNNSTITRIFTYGNNNLVTIGHKIQFIATKSFTISELAIGIPVYLGTSLNASNGEPSILLIERTKVSPIVCSAGKSVAINYNISFRVLMPDD